MKKKNSLRLIKLYEKMQQCRGCRLGLPSLNPPGSRLKGWGERSNIVFVGMNPSNRRIPLHKLGTWTVFPTLPENICQKDATRLGLIYSKELEGWVAANDAPLLLALKILGLQREDVYITNLVKCCTEDNRLKYDRDFDVIEKCKELFLLNEIKLLEPRIVIGLGSVFLKSFGLKKFGEKRELILCKNHRIIVSTIHHPGYFKRKGALSKNKNLIIAYAKEVSEVINGG